MLRRIIRGAKDLGTLIVKNTEIWVENTTKRMPNVNDEQAQRAQEMLKSAVKNGAKGTGGIGAGIVLTDAIHEPDRQKQLSSEYGQRRFNLGELKENASRAVKLAYTELELVSNKYNELGRRRELKAALKHVFNLNSVDQMPDNIYEKHNLQNVITAANYEEAQVALAALDHDNSFRTMTEQQFDILKNADRFIQKVKNLRLIYKQNLEIIVDNATLEHSTKMIIENDKITLELPIRTKLANLRLPETEQVQPVTVSEKNLSPRDLKNYIDWKFGELPEANGITVDECPYPTVPLRRLLKISIKQRVNQAYPDFAKEYSVANAVDMLDNWKTTQITHISPSNNPSSSPASSSDPGTTTHFPLPSVEEQIFPGAHIPGQGSPSSATGGGGPSSIEDGKESQLNFKTAKLNVTSSTSDDLYPVADGSTNIEGCGLNSQQTSSPSGDSDVVSTFVDGLTKLS